MSAKFFLAQHLRDSARRVYETSAPVGLTEKDKSDFVGFMNTLLGMIRHYSRNPMESEETGFGVFIEQVERYRDAIKKRETITLDPRFR